MLPVDELTLAIDIHARSYKLLRWVSDDVERAFNPRTRSHEFANVADVVLDWVEQHYLNFPIEMRPDRRHLSQFANYFSTYVLTSFDVIDQPGMQLVSSCGCYCPLCWHLMNAGHLKTKKLSKRDKNRAVDLMVDRVTALALEEGIQLKPEAASKIVHDEETRRCAGYSTYGHWLIERMDGYSDGKSILALWREIAWYPTGSPRKFFKLRFKDFRFAEEALIEAMQTALLS
ncbi:hypothetical protein [Gimesia aquarii]|uniref:Uncharacterized protein n=1 Tax=Gimesia aquarii TaxID=2527964 RepID=A0A517WVY8_9PLAN|nr:hypothetical protein [Gimesia aquarii]QDU09435.1 hypothetical protein V202x_28100 [Gimesia aquarii]